VNAEEFDAKYKPGDEVLVRMRLVFNRAYNYSQGA